MSGSGLESTVGVGDSASRVVVEVALDIAANNTAQSSDQIVDLTRAGTTDSVCDTDTVDTNLVDCAVKGQKVDKVGTEAVFRGKSNFEALGLDEFDDFNRSVLCL